MNAPLPSQVPATKPEPVRVIGAITSGAAVVSTGISSIAFFSDNQAVMGIAALVGLVCVGVNVGMTAYLRGQVTPAADVISYVNEDRVPVAGLAAGASAGEAVADPIPGPVEQQPE